MSPAETIRAFLKASGLLNAINLALGQGAIRGSSFVVSILIGRQLGAESLGDWSFALAVVALAATVPDLGIDVLVVREVAREPKRAAWLLEASLPVKAIASLGALMGLAVLLVTLADAQLAYVALVLSAYVFSNSFTRLFLAVIRAHEEMHWEAMLRIGQSSVILVGAVVLCFYRPELSAFAWLYAFTGIVALVVTAVFIGQRYVPFTLGSWDLKSARQLLRMSWPFAVGSFFVLIYYRADIIILGLLRDSRDVGHYAAAYSILLAAAAVPEIFYTALFPRLSRAFVDRDGAFEGGVRYALSTAAVGAGATGLALALFAPPLVSLVFGPAFEDAVGILRVLAVVGALRWVNGAAGTTLSAMNRQGYRSAGQALSAFSNVGANLALIPAFGVLGAAWATVLSEILLASATLASIIIFMRRRNRGKES